MTYGFSQNYLELTPPFLGIKGINRDILSLDRADHDTTDKMLLEEGIDEHDRQGRKDQCGHPDCLG